MHQYFRVLLAAAIISAAVPAQAENDVVLGAGWFNFNRSDNNSTNFSGEWRGNPFFYDLRPDIGFQVNTDGGAYGYAGLNYDWEFTPRWVLVPEVDIGAWRNGSSIDLGGTFEFHESLELDYKFYNDYRVGAQIAHTSNAGIYDTNPGVNTLMAVFSFPL